jgi:arylformamidase
VTIEAIALQCARAMAWAWRHADAHRGDRRRLVVAGHSAGGHLAAMLLACRWSQLAADLPEGLGAAALSISGLFDLEPIRRTGFLQPDLGLTAASVDRLSPARFAAPQGRLHALVGGDESDEFRRQNRLIAERWGSAVVPVCEELPGLNHFTVLNSLAASGGRAHDCACSLLGL